VVESTTQFSIPTQSYGVLYASGISTGDEPNFFIDTGGNPDDYFKLEPNYEPFLLFFGLAAPTWTEEADDVDWTFRFDLNWDQDSEPDEPVIVRVHGLTSSNTFSWNGSQLTTDGTELLEVVYLPSFLEAGINWATQDLTFTINGSFQSIVFSFQSGGVTSSARNGYDNIEVIPEPQTWFLLTMGFGLIALVTFRSLATKKPVRAWTACCRLSH
jgi:hypothetical protein